MTDEQSREDPEARVRAMLRTAASTERAPRRLHAEIRAAQTEANLRVGGIPLSRSARANFGSGGGNGDGEQPRAARSSRGRLGRSLALPMLLCIIVVGAAFLRGADNGGVPTLRQIAALSTLSPAGEAPNVDTSNGSQLAAEVEGLHFPNWTNEGWRASGVRHDQVQGRDVTTVFYSDGTYKLAYSIVASPQIPDTISRGQDHQSFKAGSRTYVTWTVDDHTCMISAVGVTAEQLWRLGYPTLPAGHAS